MKILLKTFSRIFFQKINFCVCANSSLKDCQNLETSVTEKKIGFVSYDKTNVFLTVTWTG